MALTIHYGGIRTQVVVLLHDLKKKLDIRDSFQLLYLLLLPINTGIYKFLLGKAV